MLWSIDSWNFCLNGWHFGNSTAFGIAADFSGKFLYHLPLFPNFPKFGLNGWSFSLAREHSYKIQGANRKQFFDKTFFFLRLAALLHNSLIIPPVSKVPKEKNLTCTISGLVSLHLVSSNWPESIVWDEVSVVRSFPGKRVKKETSITGYYL